MCEERMLGEDIVAEDRERTDEVLDALKGARLGMLGVFLVLGAIETVQEMPPASTGDDLVYRIGEGSGVDTVSLIIVAAVVLFVSGVIYATIGRDATFGEIIFSWPLVIVAGVIALLVLISQPV
jgi:uncharacterized membrane protein YedE/YeeE